MKDRNLSRRNFAALAGSTGAALALAMSPQAMAAQPAKPNLLLIFSDQQHWRAMGFMDPFFDTPNLDALAKESTVFERSFCTTPQCSPSRSSLLTGFYPSATGVMGNTGALGGNDLAQPTLAPELQAAGYYTGYFGKWHLGNEEVATNGWDQSDLKTKDPLAEKTAVGFLKQADTFRKPFALFVSMVNPHDIYAFQKHKPQVDLADIPLPPSWEGETFADKPPIQEAFMRDNQGTVIVDQPRQEWQKYRDCYRTKTKLYDSHVGVILDELKRQGQWDNTIVIATSDHGDMDTCHKLIFKGPFMYEQMMRIPLMIRVPKKFANIQPRHIKEIDVVNVDIAPTIRDLCGLAERPSHGSSLVPLMTGSTAYQPREFVIGQYYGKQKWVNPIRMIRTPEFKLNRHILFGDELYDLKNDPIELHNLAHDLNFAEVKEALVRKLDQWIVQHNDPFYSLKVTTMTGQEL
jgi:arylsulfatase A-like enzyme